MGLTEKPPLVSIIVPTYNRCDELTGLLESLSKQTMPDFEVIVIDDGSQDGTFERLQQHAGKLPFALRVERQQNLGPGAARNRGTALACAALLAFTDTDCRPFPDWLERMLETFADPQVGAAGGAEEVEQHDSPVMQAIHFCMTSRLTTGGMRGSAGKKLAKYYPRTFNMAVRREAFEKAGGFRQMYHGEDIELSYRIRQTGYRLLFNADARVYHRRRCSAAGFFRQVIKMGEARVTLARLHPSMLEPLHVLPALALLLFGALTACAPFSKFLFICTAAGYALALIGLLCIGVAAAAQTRTPALFVLAPLMFAVQQSAYGIGFWAGCLHCISGKSLPA